MKKLNRLDVLVKKHLTNKEQRFIAKHSKKRVIDIDSDEDDTIAEKSIAEEKLL